tara:strand:+ start:521 stop:2152 length:1632 start_codon:yes stop_codon:yes gene_type:complete
MNSKIGIISKNVDGEIKIHSNIIPGESSINIGSAGAAGPFNKVYVGSNGIDIDGLGINKITEENDLLQLPNNLKIGSSYIKDSNGTIMIGAASSNMALLGYEEDWQRVSLISYVQDAPTFDYYGTMITGESTFGISVEISRNGKRMVVGNNQSFRHGLVKVFEMSASNNWIQIGNNIPGDAPEVTNGDSQGNFGFSVSINNDGSRVVVGANMDGIYGQANLDHGLMRVYEYNGSDWVQLGTDIIGEYSQQYFGGSVSMNGSGDIIVGGSFIDPSIGGNPSSTHPVSSVYSWNGSVWNKLGNDDLYFSGNEVSTGDVLNSRVNEQVLIAKNSNTVVITAGYWNNINKPGYVKCYDYDSNSNTFSARPLLQGDNVQDSFGNRVSISDNGNIVAVGAPTGNGNTGYVSIYEYSSSNSTWSIIGKFLGTIDGERFGYFPSLNSNGDVVAITRPSHLVEGVRGIVSFYKNNNNGISNWDKIGSDIRNYSSDGPWWTFGHWASLSDTGIYITSNYVKNTVHTFQNVIPDQLIIFLLDKINRLETQLNER